ncbi:MAG TPA: tripartite tricarboxylate transporter substrate binding protein [Burkholderiales bacterium]|nr:tripartite tricarboxylate transporter substrate binding protein [Burkholderiales bacterium]
MRSAISRPRLALLLSAVASLAALGSAPVLAQAYPSKTIRMILPYAPGGSVDVIARVISPRLAESIGQQVVVDNRPGAAGNIGTELAARAPADGYTILLVTIPLVVNPSLYSRVPYDAVRDFAPVSLLAASPFVLASHPSLPVRTVKELLALARKQPGKLNYGSGGAGTNSHIAAELLKYLTSTDIVHVPYKGGGPALIGFLGGETQLTFLGVEPLIAHLRSGRARPLGITSTRRSPILPELPTIAEAGVPGYDFTTWYGVFVPSGTPSEAIAVLNEHFAKVVRAPDMLERFGKDGTEVIASLPAQLGTHVQNELARWSKVVKQAGLRAD